MQETRQDLLNVDRVRRPGVVIGVAGFGQQTGRVCLHYEVIYPADSDRKRDRN